MLWRRRGRERLRPPILVARRRLATAGGAVALGLVALLFSWAGDWSQRRFGAFERHLTLPPGVDPASITASMEHGVLSLLVPRPVRPEPRRIAVGSA